MKRGQAIYPILILSIVMLLVIVLLTSPNFQQIPVTGEAVSSCVPQWNCTSWSKCLTGTQTRVCIDGNSCGADPLKPIEHQTCEIQCQPNWQCTDWVPEVCPENERQTKTCTDLNNCETLKLKPAEARLCGYNPLFDGLFFLIVFLVILLILLSIALIIKKWKELNEPSSFPRSVVSRY